MSQEVANTWDAFMAPWEPEFTEKNRYGLVFESECHFAKQAILSSSFLLSTAQSNPQSLHDAIVNSSAIGISLNPALKHAYLVPRDKAVRLDISFLGLVKLACDSGAIITATAELVHGPRGNYPGDKFTWKGPYLPPEHEAEVFHADRINGDDPLENVIGGYCVAILPSQTVVVTKMSQSEILAVRNTSKAFQSGKANPWKGAWSGEMAKKTLLKRGSKSWPQVEGRERLDHAISILNEHEGLRDINQGEEAPDVAPDLITAEQQTQLVSALTVASLTEEKFCKMAGITEVRNLAAERYEGAMARIQQIASRGVGHDR